MTTNLPDRAAEHDPDRAYLPMTMRSDTEPVWLERTVGDLADEAATSHPDRDAVIVASAGEPATSVTWGRIGALAGRVAGSLIALNPANGRVAIIGSYRIGWALTMFAAARAGLSVVALPSVMNADFLAAYCRQAEVDLVVGTDRTAWSGPDPLGVRVAFVEDLVSGTPVGLHEADPSDPFLYQFTSGTTGKPKLAVLSHRAVIGAARAFVIGAGGRDGSVVLNPLPLEHVGGSVAGLLGALTVAGSYSSVDRITPEAIATAVRDSAPTIVGLVPTMIIDLLDKGGLGESDFETVVSVVGGATSVDPGLITRLEERLGVRFLVSYGQSEAPCVSLSDAADSLAERATTIGRPLPGRDCCIAVDGQVVGPGVVGELFVRGPLVMSGYYDDGRIDSCVDEHGWLATGDLCSARDGVITFHARLRDVVIRGGENIYPAEVEAALADQLARAEISVFGIPDERLGEVVAAAVRLPPGSDIGEEELRAAAAERLPRKSRPEHWFLVDDFPRTSTGKIRRTELARALGRSI